MKNPETRLHVIGNCKQNNKMKKRLGYLLFAIGLILYLLPFYFWAGSPKLTQMEVVLHYWEYLFGGTALIVIGGYYAEIKY